MFTQRPDYFSFRPVIDLITPTAPMLLKYLDVVLATVNVFAPLATDTLGCLLCGDRNCVVDFCGLICHFIPLCVVFRSLCPVLYHIGYIIILCR
jgi:hypothetical protein